jgi:hypothetical protein
MLEICIGYIQTHCQKNKKIKRADQILPEVHGTTIDHSYIGQVDAKKRLKRTQGYTEQ